MLNSKKERYLLSHGQEIVLSNYLRKWPNYCNFEQICRMIEDKNRLALLCEPFSNCHPNLLIHHMKHLSSIIDKTIVETDGHYIESQLIQQKSRRDAHVK
jgi:hypothetical protein